MVDFGDDLLLEGYRIPWLVWIQFLVMFLLALAILLSYFALDSSPNHDDFLISFPQSLVDPYTSCLQRTQVSAGEETSTSTSNTTRGAENNSERDGFSSKDLITTQGSERFFHPCRYFDLAKQAFLSCLGLGSSSTSRKSRTRGHEHED